MADVVPGGQALACVGAPGTGRTACRVPNPLKAAEAPVDAHPAERHLFAGTVKARCDGGGIEGVQSIDLTVLNAARPANRSR
jgi:hypothetical protein